MQPTDDSALLRQYAENNSDEAFAALVTRHVNLVYSVALRQVGNPHHAEEITQAVFIILAKKAAQLRCDKALSSWLFQATRLTANNFVRSEARRHRREEEAYMQSVLDEAGTEVWTKIAPLLDTAVANLREKDRRAIVLRFYEGRNLREVGLALGASEDAAEKRVNRALEKLRKFFTKRGVSSTTAIIAGTISANSVQAAPVALAKSVTAVAIAKGAAASGSTLTLIKGALKIMAWTKAKTAVVVGTTVIVVTLGAGYFSFFHKTHPNQPGKLKLPVGEISPAIGFGRTHGIILASDGSLWAWGENDLGWPALGLGNIQKTAFLNRIGNENDWVNIVVGESHNLALKQDGTIWAWGGNLYDELGNHPNYLRDKKIRGSDFSSTPIKSALGGDWKYIAAGAEDSFGIKNDGTLWAWGLNDFGQLGIGNFKDNPMPSQIGSATWTKIYAGFINTAGVQSDGSLWVWGGGASVGNTAARGAENYSAPTRISPDTNWMDIAVGENVVFVIKSDGTLWAWGYDAWIFTGTHGNNATLAEIGTDNDWQACSCSGSHYLLLMKKNGSLWSMRPPDSGKPAQLKQINLQKGVVAIGGGGGLGAALTRDGEVWTWGNVIGEHLELSPKFTVLDNPWQLSNLEKAQ
jgi:RNA polymerase sigma factor (sigma-70 family)